MSHYSQLKKERTIGSMNTRRIADLDETDPFYFVASDGDRVLAEGELPTLKLKLPDMYLYKPIKSIRRDRANMTAFIDF